MTTRRSFLSTTTSAGLLAPTVHAANAEPSVRPNIVIIISDQVRHDCVNAYGQNPTFLTPNIDALAHSGTLFRNAFVTQPVCSPSRASMFTGQYPARHGVWRNTGHGVGLNPATPTIATELSKAGYSANYIGKWHLADGPAGPVAPAARGGFLGLWEAANELELTSHPYYGELYDGDGNPIPFKDQYRVDFMKGLALKFLENVSTGTPFLLCVSFLEPHHQNDLGRMVAPKELEEKYKNPFVSPDLRSMPGDYLLQLTDYYGCISSVDTAVGDIVRAVPPNTIVVFLSDHGCHFKTRNTEYKRSGHDSSIHVPLIIGGPGFSGGHEVQSFTSTVDLMPMLLKAANVPVPSSCQISNTPNEIFVQMSEYWTARALRTPEYTYVVAAPREPKYVPKPNAPRYNAFQLYDNQADPYQQVNLCGHQEYVAVEAKLRERLLARMAEAGDPPTEILPTEFPYC
jgi:arylsulfatase A-like enzyme